MLEIAKSAESVYCYLNLTTCKFQTGETKTEYRAWNPFRSKLAAAILGGVDQIHMAPGKKVLYLGAASGTTVSHVSDIVGPVSSRYLSKCIVECLLYLCMYIDIHRRNMYVLHRVWVY